MENTPRSNRIHIGIFGRCNSGKSSLLNTLAGQYAAIVSEEAGTTTDVVAKSMEIPGLGAVTLLDTAGFDDGSPLGVERLAQTRRAARQSDIAVVVLAAEASEVDSEWIGMFREKGVSVIAVLNKCDLLADRRASALQVELRTGMRPVVVSARTGEGVGELLSALAAAGSDAACERSITGGLVRQGETVVLVMPQDGQAPKGRLILPQAQTLRELLDKNCTAVCCIPEKLEPTLRNLTEPPSLVITDSQVFDAVARLTPPDVPLTSFSILFAHHKGDIAVFMEGAAAIDRLGPGSKVLIAEACTHAPAGEDIGRVKLPRLLRSRAGEGLAVEVVSGADFPDDLSSYDLVIHCGACMFNRRYVLSRIVQAAAQGIPITNYGIAIAHLSGIPDRVVFPRADCNFSK